MLQQDSPEDFVIATGVAHSVREFVIAAFQYIGVDIAYVAGRQFLSSLACVSECDNK